MPNSNFIKDYPIKSIVAEFDILGFKEIILKPPKGISLQNIADSYQTYFTRNIYSSKDELAQKAQFQIFSDTAVIYQKYMETNAEYSDNYKIKLYDFFRHLCIIMMNSIFAFEANGVFVNRISEFPIRGGIAVGEMIIKDVNCTTPILMGKPIIEAYEWEQKQNWLGLSINPSCVSDIKELLARQHFRSNSIDDASIDYWQKLVDENILVEYDVPTKSGLVSTWVVNFVPSGKSSTLVNELSKALKKYAKQEPIYAKYYATKKFVEFVIDSNKAIDPELLKNSFSNI